MDNSCSVCNVLHSAWSTLSSMLSSLNHCHCRLLTLSALQLQDLVLVAILAAHCSPELFGPILQLYPQGANSLICFK